MEQYDKKYTDLAERIYDLDTEVYTLVGSGLGRTLTAGKEKSVHILARELSSGERSDLVISDLALIARMARTIQDKQQKKQALSKYNAIMKEVNTTPSSVTSFDILDRRRISLNPFASGAKKFTDDDHLLICIGRSYGSAGTDIGFRLADDLHINYYDATVFKDVLERLQAERETAADSTIEKTLEKMHRLHGIRLFTSNFNRFHGLPTEDALFFNQSQYIEDLAKKEDFVVMGRCADVVLRNAGIPHVSIFINAPFDIRVKRVMEMHKLSRKAAEHLVKKEDKAHAKFYHRYTGYQWGDSVHYDLCINSASYGIEESEELIIRVIRARIHGDLAAAAAQHEAQVAAAQKLAEKKAAAAAKAAGASDASGTAKK